MVAAGAKVVLVDFCGYGASTCPAGSPWESDYVAQVTAVVSGVRAKGARRITLVGASLGGTVALGAAGPTRADAVVDLSGFDFLGLTTTAPLARLKVPVLAAGSRDELADTDRLAREVAASPAPVKHFVQAVTGHGWSLMAETPLEGAPLTPLGETVVRWAAGRVD